MVSKQVLGLGAESTLKEVKKKVHHKCFESRFNKLSSAMTSLIKILAGKGMGQDIKNEEESMHKVPIHAQNGLVSATSKVKDNILPIKIVPVIAPHVSISPSPEVKLLCILVKVLNTLLIK